VRLLRAVVLLVVLTAAVGSSCTSTARRSTVAGHVAGSTSESARSGTPPGEPPPQAYAAGICHTIAEPVEALARFTWQHTGQLTLTERRQLRPISDRLMAAAKAATRAERVVSDRIGAVVARLGAVRLLITGAYDETLLRAVENARAALRDVCLR
jgi:hypothetical protein